ncbi:hypothetical protein G7046_g9429 [Stylonectria norvegica]|nr:hypothetical protein G7046_g9429 [Stylonectria norvegica]
MSASYWDSTQRRHWQFNKEQLMTKRQKLENDNADLVRMFPLPQPRHLYIFYCQQLNKLAKRLQIRQQPIATAQIYVKRFYTKVEIRRTNPYLVMATALYVACKMEECPQHIRVIITEARNCWADMIAVDISKLGECEFFLISELSSQLIIHQPFRTITALRPELALVDEDVQLAKSVVNDHFQTDLPLLYPPHIVALVAILLALVLRPNPSIPGQSSSGAAAAAGLAAAQAALGQAQSARITQGGNQEVSSSSDIKDRQQEVRVSRVHRFAVWLAESNVDIASMVDATQEIISFYECYEQYNDKLTREQINRFIKARVFVPAATAFHQTRERPIPGNGGRRAHTPRARRKTPHAALGWAPGRPRDERQKATLSSLRRIQDAQIRHAEANYSQQPSLHPVDGDAICWRPMRHGIAYDPRVTVAVVPQGHSDRVAVGERAGNTNLRRKPHRAQCLLDLLLPSPERTGGGVEDLGRRSQIRSDKANEAAIETRRSQGRRKRRTTLVPNLLAC